MGSDLHELAKRLQPGVDAWLAGASVASLEPLQGGRSSLTYRVELARGSESRIRIVVKVAPAGLPPVRNRDVLRQARVLRALSGVAGVRVPEVLFEDPGAPPELPPLFAMGFVEGECFEPIMDEAPVLPPAQQIRERALAAARMLASLHAARPGQLGLAAEPEVDLAEEVERWVRIFASVDASLSAGYREIADDLLAARPEPLASSVIHGEFRLGNTLCRAGEVRAIIDWELWARGDPRVDLAWLLQFADPASTPSAIRSDVPGLPAPRELLEAYERARGAAVPGLAWFDAHARFKQAAITAIQCKLNRKRSVPDPVQEANARLIPEFFQTCSALLARSREVRR